jgi:hypothetical protein
LPEGVASPPLVIIRGRLHAIFHGGVHFQATFDASMTPAIGEKLPEVLDRCVCS